MKAKLSLPKLIICLLILTGSWGVVFQTTILNFWYRLTLLALIQLAAAKIYFEVDLEWSTVNIIWGLGLALGLYLIFWLGNIVSQLIWPDASSQISSVYSYREQLNPAAIALLLGLVVGPAEEFFWRGLLQTKLGEKVGRLGGYLATAGLYAGIHLWTGNLILILAALTAGLFWGAWRWQQQKLVPLLISHSLWDLMVFIWFPFTN